MTNSSLEQAVTDLSREVRALGERISAVAPSPLDQVGRPAGGLALGSRLETVKPGGLTYWDRGADGVAPSPEPFTIHDSLFTGSTPPPPRDLGTSPINVGGGSGLLTSDFSPLTSAAGRSEPFTNGRVLRHIEDRSLADWISAEILAYDRKELREAVAKLRDMMRKLLEDVFRQLFEQALGLGHWALGKEALGSGLSALGSGPGLLTSYFSPFTLAGGQSGLGALGSGLGVVKPGGLTYWGRPLNLGAAGVGGWTSFRPFTIDNSPFTSWSPPPPRDLGTSPINVGGVSEPFTSHDSPFTTPEGRQEVHFHIHDAAAVSPILRNRNAMLVRTAALIDQQRALTRRPRGR